MKNNKSFFKVAAMTIGVAILMTGCGSSKKNVSITDKNAMGKAGGQGITIIDDLPCQGNDSDEKYIVVSAEGRSKDRTMAKDKAYLAALARLASKLEAVASNEVKRTGVSTDADAENEDFHAKVLANSKEVAKNVKVGGYRTSCEKFALENGSYVCFVTIEYGKQEIVKQMYDGLRKEKILRADYDFDRYMKEFEQDLKEHEKNNR